jgi:hypothetical protein
MKSMKCSISRISETVKERNELLLHASVTGEALNEPKMDQYEEMD